MFDVWLLTSGFWRNAAWASHPACHNLRHTGREPGPPSVNETPPCLNSAPPASTATRRCRPPHRRPVSVLTNARSAPPVSQRCSPMSVQTAAAVLCQGPSGPRTTGKTAIASSSTRPRRKSRTSQLILPLTRSLPRSSKPFRPNAVSRSATLPRHRSQRIRATHSPTRATPFVR